MENLTDIDLRFVMRAVPAPEFGEDLTKNVPVLQWRKRFRTTGARNEFRSDNWTEWQDVRTDEG